MGIPIEEFEAIYAANQDAAHNLVAYGSLVSSDGMASTVRSDVRILVIDDETGDSGEALRDYAGKPLAPEDVERILDKLGDGTMLVSSDLMAQLRTPAEVLANADLTPTVTQFRAASPDFPGIAKGTAGTSDWCEYLDVDAIVAKNDIKGDDGRFSAPGVKELSEFWVNRKSDGAYGQQSVGPQVKGTLPEATLQEFNPEMLRKGQALAAIASDHFALAQAYIKSKARFVTEEVGDNGMAEEVTIQRHPDPIAEMLKADSNGLLVGMERINRELERFVRNQRVDLAVNGIEVPSAMAQHHNALKPWEVANKDLPQGAIVAYYRSPFANVGSAAIAVNNHRALRYDDPEAHAKTGVAYLHPWTAKHIAVTDFDKDANGYFVGFVPTDGDANGIGSKVAQSLRDRLATVESLPLNQQYEAGRAAIAQLIAEAAANPMAALIQPADYPLAVTEMVERNAPEHKPPDIIKAPKIKHDWRMGEESASAATWRAWEITANNPTGRVANAAMNLRSLAMETQYIPNEQAEDLLQQIAQHYQGVMTKHRQGQVVIPTDPELTARGYPAYGFAERMQAIADAGATLDQIQDPTDRRNYTRTQLNAVNQLLNDFVDGPVAENLQTAVDVAKSQRGIDEAVYQLSREMAYKDHDLRTHKKDRTVYTQGQLMPTNTQEPIGWGVEQANALYDGSQLHQNPHNVYYGLFEQTATPEQQADALDIARRFKALQDQGTKERHLDKNAREHQQPTFTITMPQGRSFTIQRPIDAPAQELSPVWDAQDGPQPDWTITIKPNPQIDPKWNPAPFKAYLQVGDAFRQWELGSIANDGGLMAKDNGTLVLTAPEFTLNPPATEQVPATESFRQADAYLQAAIADLSATDRQAYAGVMWRGANTNSAAIKAFQPEIMAAITAQQMPTMTIVGMQHNVDLNTWDSTADRQLLFVPYDKAATAKTLNGHQVPVTLRQMFLYDISDPDQEPQRLGLVEDRGLRLPAGTVATGQVALNRSPTGRTAVAQLHLTAVMPERLPVEAIASSLKTAMDTAQLSKQAGKADHSKAVLPPIKARWDTARPVPETAIGFNPNRSDLREWFTAVAITSPQGNQDPRLKEISNVGKVLNMAYCQETGKPLPTDKAQVQTPMNYWHPNVTLTPAQNRDRVLTIALYQQQQAGHTRTIVR